MNNLKLNNSNIVSYIEDIFKRRGNEVYAGEDVTISKHMIQICTIAKKRGLNNEIVVPSLLHDIGHFNSEFVCSLWTTKKIVFMKLWGLKSLNPFSLKLLWIAFIFMFLPNVI